MLIRIKFSKSSAVKFIGHLDLMRYFQKAIRRTDLDIKYTQGYHPHQIMSFALPLGVGLTSDGEYMDIELNSDISCDDIMNKLNAVMNEGITVIKVTKLDDPLTMTKKETSMSMVYAADYLISVKDNYKFDYSFNEFCGKFKDYLDQEEITVLKKSKKAERYINLKPFVYDYAFNKADFHALSEYKDYLFISDCSEKYENDLSFYICLSAGSENNIKPELLIESFCDYCKTEFNEYAYQYHRLELYTNKEGLIPLWAAK